MKFFAIHLEDLESEKFLSASSNQIATWLFLHALCCKQTNGGTIPDAASVSDRFWSRHGIDKATLDAPSPLWSWGQNNLTVEPYDIDGQSLFEKKSAGGKTGANRRWNGSPNRSPNAPYPTQPDPTLPLPKRNRSIAVFQKPNVEMVAEYGATLTPPFTSASDFMDYYDSNGWKIGTSPMKDWRATVRRWNRKRQDSAHGTQAKPRFKFAGTPEDIPLI